MDLGTRKIAEYRDSIYIHASLHAVRNARILKHAVGSEEHFDHPTPVRKGA